MKVVKIKSIKRIENDSKLYDIETSRNHNFYANNILVHNSNFSILFNEDGTWNFCRRGAQLNPDDSFFNYQKVFEKLQYKDFINKVSKYCKIKGIGLQFIGELYGPKINGRIDYGSEKEWKWYAIRQGMGIERSRLLTVGEENNIIKTIGRICISLLYVPLITSFSITGHSIQGFQNEVEKLVSSIRVNSKLSPEGIEEGTNLMEGVVIRPYATNYFSSNGEIFIIKLKNPEFVENQGTKKEHKPPIDLPEDITNIFNSVMNYVNENRTISVFSKNGVIDSPKEIGKYIPIYYNDVVEDVEKDLPGVLDSLEKTHRKILNKSINQQIVIELKKNL